jgi:small subunit ribosomal protein S2
MADVGIRELLESGVHFGHQTRRWNPKMRRFIHGERGGIYIIDLLKTQALLEQAQQFSSEVAHRGGTVLFVGTKKQARDSVKEVAEAAGMPYVHHRWLGGLLTNFQTISLRIKRLHDLERYAAEGQLALLPTRERMAAQADLAKLQANLGGVKNMQRPPDAMFVVDLKTEVIAVQEAKRLRIPIIGLVDTNCDPDGIDYVIPGNDDAIKSCAIITQAIGDVVSQGYQTFRAEEERARQEAEEQARKEAEARAAREEEERQRKEAEEAAARQAERDAQEAAAAAALAPAEAAPPAPSAAAPAPAAQAPAAETVTTAKGGGDKGAAEAEVAEAVEAEGRPVVEGTGSAEAGAAAQAADEPAMAAAGTGTGPSQQEERREGDTGEQVPQEAGAAQAEGSPASDTAAPPRRKPVTRPPAEAGKKPARKPRAKKADKKEEPNTGTEKS